MKNVRAPGPYHEDLIIHQHHFSFSGFLEAEDFLSKTPRFSTCAMVRESVKRKPQLVLEMLRC